MRHPLFNGVAESLPLVNDAVDAALAVLTIHHWRDPERGLAEMRRVARDRIVIMTWDQELFEDFWLVQEYLPCIAQVDRPRAVAIDGIVGVLGKGEVSTVGVPHDCVDGFLGAFWRRPKAYLDPRVRMGISAFSTIPPAELEDGLRRLAADIDSGAWQEQHRSLAELDELDLGYRILVAY